ncbi:MAG: histidine--tRNA ligase [Candidatus Omnitrophica bacterium]|nr:histidine--tRNA ligase [Candidatus Omnitrophota bacterium]
MTNYRSLRGMPDMLPDDAELFRAVEEKARKVFDIFEFREIRTPIMEDNDVFTRSIGAETDIVEKEMYTFSDRGGKQISLRPEATASIVRAFIEHGMHGDNEVCKLFYVGPMFRAERPQKGRLRQFHQIGAEIIGSKSITCDAELIVNVKAVLDSLGINDPVISVNSLGCPSDRETYKKVLGDFLASNMGALCENCVKRSTRNVLRVLDCKSEKCKETLKGAPVISDHLCGGCLGEFNELKKLLMASGVVFNEKHDLVRGLDYYTGTVFELSHPSLGAQDAIAAGGRYDKLSKEMGGPDVGATGYAIGVERVLLILKDRYTVKKEPGVLVICLDEKTRERAFTVVNRLRENGIRADMDHSARSLKGGLRKANRENRKKVVIIGEDELARGTLLVKDMASGEQKSVVLDALVGEFKQ